jgi:DNA-directed RNA polymerase subunit RPC12/RpoP
MIDIRYKCGTAGQLNEQFNGTPVCPHCGTTEIVFVKPPRMPRFTGACTGPYATHSHADPAVVNVAPAGPLVIKEGKQ